MNNPSDAAGRGHNPNDVLRRHLSWVRTRRAVVDALLACCKIEHESSLLSFHLSLLDSPLEVCYSVCTRAKRLLKSLVHEKPNSSQRWKRIVITENVPSITSASKGSLASHLFDQWLDSIGGLLSTPEECDSMIRLVDGLQRNLLHNVSDDLEEVLALGHQLQGSLSSKAKAG